MGMPYAQKEFLLGTRLCSDPIIEEERKRGTWMLGIGN